MGLVVAAAQVAEVVRGAKGAQAGPARKAMDLKGQLDPLETRRTSGQPGKSGPAGQSASTTCSFGGMSSATLFTIDVSLLAAALSVASSSSPSSLPRSPDCVIRGARGGGYSHWRD